MPLDLPPLTFAGAIDRDALRPAVDLLVGLADRPEVAAAWDDESSCTGMTVGALTWHLVNQPRRVVSVLTGAATHVQPITLDRHYAQVAWLREDLDGPANVGVRKSALEEAAAGPGAAVEAARAAREQLDEVLAQAGLVVLVPWQGTALATDDFLVTRLMEIVVHSDDLASSVGLPTPRFAPAALTPVVSLLTDLALRRHGQDALVRTLSRPQRAPATVSAF